MTDPMRGDQVRATVTVALPPATAFTVFTDEIDRWWRRGRRFRNAPGEAGIVRIEPGVGGRLFESFGSGADERVVEIGRTLVWDPPRRLVLSWRNATFAAGEHTEVEVVFAPSASGTTVVLDASRLERDPRRPSGAPRARGRSVLPDDGTLVGRPADGAATGRDRAPISGRARSR